jgi:hypothetical protein
MSNDRFVEKTFEYYKDGFEEHSKLYSLIWQNKKIY